MALERRAIVLLSLALVATSACTEERADLGPPTGCENGDPGCGVGVGYGATAGSGGGGTGGQGGQQPEGDLIGTVSVISDLAFQTTVPHGGTATIVAVADDGTTVSADYNGDVPFQLEGVQAGDTWVLVDAAAEDDVLDAITLQQVPGSDAEVPVVAREVLDSIAGTLSLGLIDPGLAQLVIQLERSGVPLEGVSLIGASFGGTVAYDEGAGSYSSIAAATGSAGVILVLDATMSGSIGFIELTVQPDDGGPAVVVRLPATNGAVTVAGFEI